MALSSIGIPMVAERTAASRQPDRATAASPGRLASAHMGMERR
ncbi:hypothetical protein [Microtetraspora malaysiensis]